MTESAVLGNESAEAQPVPSVPAIEEVQPVRKPKRFLAGLRFNGLRYLVLSGSLLGAWGLVRVAMWQGGGTPESTFLLVLAGGLLAAAGKTAIDILSWADANRQATHVERVRAVQRVFRRACVVREQALFDWRRIHTVLVDNLTGESRETRLFHDHDETDRQAASLFQKALTEEMWIRPEGVDAVRHFKSQIATLNYKGLTTEPEFLAAFNALMDTLRRDLALAAIGIPLE